MIDIVETITTFSGWVWYVYPLGSVQNLEIPPDLQRGNRKVFPIKQFNSVGHAEHNGFIIISASSKKPPIPEGWELVPLQLPDGFGGVIEDGRVLRHLHTDVVSRIEDKVTSVHAVFALVGFSLD